MAQKDKVKELVGRGLDSYHTKSLQQIDRIERKNKEQNHKINILTNELDNDYLTKTEEGSVVSLEHSKEGMVYLDGLEGNTLVNYCTDGAKELTLNGDIDVEGTSVTLTEGADNGKVDVVCEGNTLVNCITTKIEGNIKFIANGTPQGFNYSVIAKGSNVYTLVANIVKNTINSNLSLIGWHIDSNNKQYSIPKGFVGAYKQSFTTKNDIGSNWYMDFWQENTEGEIELNNFMLLEGDWSNKEIPQYFEGMKSVGECEDNKIEILSQSNLADISTSGDNANFNIANLKAGKTYTIKSKRDNNSIQYNLFLVDPKDVYITKQQLVMGASKDCYTFTTTKDGVLRFNGYSNPLNVSEIMLVEGVYTDSTMPNFKPYSMNKKEISLNEPLRGLPNGAKDRFIKQGGKWYIERNCGKINYSNSTWSIYVANNLSNCVQFLASTNFGSFVENTQLCDKLKYIKTTEVNSTSTALSPYSISLGYQMSIYLPIGTTLEQFNKWLLENNPVVLAQLRTPTYEEITDVELITYLDTTHISNNSTIPCNMKITNSGYNAIIKPSTLYTVALDANKSGTVGINLGGAKATTTNNVVTVTTPATLTDDSLRLYGKGINASKVRLLEGNKTNWIPSHFEGMKSSFEDKLQEDGTFKMEILSNNDNLLKIQTNTFNYRATPTIIDYNNLKILPSENEKIGGYSLFDWMLFDVNKVYKITFTSNHNRLHLFNGNGEIVHTLDSGRTFNPKKSRLRLGAYCQHSEGTTYTDIKISLNDSEYTPHKSNKIQFSSIEPLRKWDRFVFKDGKLMIERNSGVKMFDGSGSWTYGNTSSGWSQNGNYKAFYSYSLSSTKKTNGESYTNYLPTTIGAYSVNSATSEVFSLGHTNYELIRIDQRKLNELSSSGLCAYLNQNPLEVVYQLKEPTYEEVPFELQKIILEGYENGTLFFDTNIPPTVTTTYAGETPIVKATKLNKTEVSNNTTDINDNIVPYLMDMDYRVVCLQLEGGIENVSMARLFGGTYEMLQRDILSNRYSKEEYKYRLDAYLSANKITEDEYTKLGDMLND